MRKVSLTILLDGIYDKGKATPVAIMMEMRTKVNYEKTPPHPLN